MAPQRLALLLLSLVATVVADGEPAAPGLRGGPAAVQEASPEAVSAASESNDNGDDDPCSAPMLSTAVSMAEACFKACPEVCAPLAASGAAWTAGVNPAFAVCGAQEQFACLVRNLDACGALLDAADGYVGASPKLPRTEEDLAAACLSASSDDWDGEDDDAAAEQDEETPAQSGEDGAALAEAGAEVHSEGWAFCNARRSGWFCYRHSRVRCCRKSWGMVRCGTINNWHGCWR